MNVSVSGVLRIASVGLGTERFVVEARDRSVGERRSNHSNDEFRSVDNLARGVANDGKSSTRWCGA